METWCFLGSLFSLPHNKADVYVCASSCNSLKLISIFCLSGSVIFHDEILSPRYYYADSRKRMESDAPPSECVFRLQRAACHSADDILFIGRDAHG